MERAQINPWSWQDSLGFSQAWRVDEPRSVVFVSGQTPRSASGQLVGIGDFEAQARQVFANLETVLEQSGASLASIVKLTVYLTDIKRLPDYARVRSELIPGPQPASTAIEVSSLAAPGMMLEVEAIAVL